MTLYGDILLRIESIEDDGLAVRTKFSMIREFVLVEELTLDRIREISIALGPVTCRFCMKHTRFFYRALACWGCPIRKKTGRRFCKGTPYYNIVVKKGWSKQLLIKNLDVMSVFLEDF